MRRGLFILLFGFGTAVAFTVGADGGLPTSAPATYNVTFAGFVKGSGQGQINGSTLSITGTVEDEAGNKGTFTATGLTIDAKSHFTGTGSVLGKSFKIGGRMDSPASTDKQLKTRRIIGSFSTSDSHYGRFVGYIPVIGHGDDHHTGN
jgi:hypothetical protein